MQIIVTGCAGYIGRQLALLLREHGNRVVGIDRYPNGDDVLDEFIQCDLLEPERYARALTGADLICHLAAAKDDWGLTAEEYYRDNVDATRALIDAGRAAGVTNWLFYSTVAVLGPSRKPLDEKAPFAAAIPYGSSKAKAEKLFHELAAEDREARILIMRPSAVYSPGAPPSTNIYRLIEAVYYRRFVTIGDGRALKTTSYLDNLLDATLFAMRFMNRGVQTYIYVDEPVLTTNELVEHTYRLLGRSRQAWRVPLWLAWPIAHVADAAAALLKMDLPITAARIRKFCTSTNFTARALHSLGFAQPVSNEDALRATTEWYSDHQRQAGGDTSSGIRNRTDRHPHRASVDPPPPTPSAIPNRANRKS